MKANEAKQSKVVQLIVNKVDGKLFEWDKPIIPALAIAAVVAMVVIAMASTNLSQCSASAEFGHGNFHQYYVEKSKPKCALLSFELTNNWDNPMPCVVLGTEGIFDVPFCDEAEYEHIEETGLTDASSIMEGADYCTDMGSVYLVYYLKCADAGTAIGSGLGYVGLAQAGATFLFLTLFKKLKMIKKNEVQPNGVQPVA